MANYRVTAPYVVLKLFDHSGKPQVNGLYQGAVVDSGHVDAAELKRHLDRGWIEKVGATPVKKAESAPVKKAAPATKSETEPSSKK